MITLHQVLDELPTLTHQERRELAMRLIELDCSPAEAEDLAACEHSAASGFSMLDEMETKDSTQ